jgi:subtilisin family serine protease
VSHAFLLFLVVLSVPDPTKAQSDRVFEAWISFKDKGFAGEAERSAALIKLEEAFDSRALARRKLRRTRPGLFDEYDLPVHQAYLEEVSATGAELRVRSRWLNGVGVLATGQELRAIESLPFVREVSDLHPYVPKGSRGGRAPADPDLRGPPKRDPSEQYGLSGPQIRQLRLDRLHEMGWRGAGVRIAVIDTGFLLEHRAYRGPGGPMKVVGEWDFMDNDPVTSPEPGDRADQHEHGTVVLGILGANMPGELVGSAPEAEYLLLKAEDAETEYPLEEKWFAAALEFAEAHGADVVSSSVVLYEGYEPSDLDGHTSVMARAWELAVGNGIIGLQGGGNSGYDEDPATHHLLTPGDAPGVVTVGAADPTGSVARFSSDGLEVDGVVKPELLAWGQANYSASPYDPDGYTTSSGTSMATPLLAGGVACLLQLHPDWSLQEIREALRASGSYFRRHGGPDPLFIQGYGLPDLFLAAGIPPGGG